MVRIIDAVTYQTNLSEGPRGSGYELEVLIYLRFGVCLYRPRRTATCRLLALVGVDIGFYSSDLGVCLSYSRFRKAA